MIQLHIIANEAEIIKEIEYLLINKNFITGATVINTVSSFKNTNNEIENVPTYLLIGRTKASLFNTIEKILKDKYGRKMPVMYGLPIVNIDIDHLAKLQKVVLD